MLFTARALDVADLVSTLVTRRMASDVKDAMSKSRKSQDGDKERKKRGTKNRGSQRSVTKFNGRIEALSGHVYDYSTRQEELFTTTTREIAGYVGRTFQSSGDIKSSILTLRTPTIAEPEDLPETATVTQRRIWEEKIKMYVKREMLLEENIKKLYAIVWGQCSDSMQAKN